MSEVLLDLKDVQDIFNSLDQLVSGLNLDITLDEFDVEQAQDVSNDIDMDETDSWINDLKDMILQSMQNKNKQNVNNTTNRTYTYIHKYIYTKPKETKAVEVGMPEYVAEHILLFMDKAFSQVNAILDILPQLTGSPLDFQRWASGIRTLTDQIAVFLPYIKEAYKVVSEEQAGGLTVKPSEGVSE